MQKNGEHIDSAAAGFEEASEAFPDERTEAEQAVMETAREDYYREYGLSQANVEYLRSLQARIDAGEEISITEVQQELDGDYVITAEACTEVVTTQKLKGINAITHNIKNFFSRIMDNIKGNNDNER